VLPTFHILRPCTTDPLAWFEDDVHFGGYFAHLLMLVDGMSTLGDVASPLRRFLHGFMPYFEEMSILKKGDFTHS
jgi:hypothetical protein